MKLIASILIAILMLALAGVVLWLGWQYWVVDPDQTRQRFFYNYWQWEIGVMILAIAAAGCHEFAKD